MEFSLQTAWILSAFSADVLKPNWKNSQGIKLKNMILNEELRYLYFCFVYKTEICFSKSLLNSIKDLVFVIFVDQRLIRKLAICQAPPCHMHSTLWRWLLQWRKPTADPSQMLQVAAIDKNVIYVDWMICIFKNYAKCKTNVLLFTPAHRQAYNEPTSKCIFIFSLRIFLPRYLLQDAPQSNNRESPKVKHRRFINRSSFWQWLYLCAIFWRNS